MKTKFKKGNLVKSKDHPEWGTGKIAKEVYNDILFHVEWPEWIARLELTLHVKDLELAETPIQRMKRLYSET